MHTFILLTEHFHGCLFICLTVVSFLSCLYRLADLVGFGVAVATGKQYYKSYPERCYKSRLTEIMLEENRTGIENILHLMFGISWLFSLWTPGQVNLLIGDFIFIMISDKLLQILISKSMLRNQETWQVLHKILRSCYI